MKTTTAESIGIAEAVGTLPMSDWLDEHVQFIVGDQNFQPIKDLSWQCLWKWAAENNGKKRKPSLDKPSTNKLLCLNVYWR